MQETKVAPEGAKTNQTGRDPTSIKIVRMLAFAIVPAAFIGLIAFSLFRTEPPTDLVDKPAPEFFLPLIEGGTLSSASLKGGPVVVNFWASWCEPCRREAPALERKWQTYEAQGVKFVGVNVQDSAEDAAAFVKEFDLTFPIVRDVDLVLYRKFGVRGLPETFFLDHNYHFAGIGSGRQLGSRGGTKILGPVEPEVLDGQILQLLKKAKQSSSPK